MGPRCHVRRRVSDRVVPAEKLGVDWNRPLRLVGPNLAEEPHTLAERFVGRRRLEFSGLRESSVEVGAIPRQPRK
jgi:hypothetical protein